MKTNKILKRIAKIEALISKVTERSSASVPQMREPLRDAKAAVIRAKEALRESSAMAKNRATKGAKALTTTTPKPSTTKRRLSAAGKKNIWSGTNKRLAAKRAAVAKATPAIAKKANAKKATAKGVAPVKAMSPTVPKVAKKALAKKAAVKVPSKKTARVVRVAKVPATPKVATVERTEQAVPEAAIQETGATAVETPAQAIPETPVT